MKYILVFLLVALGSSAFAAPLESTQNLEGTAIEGVFLQVSKLPIAKTNPYPDCYYTAVLEVKNILSGQSIPKKIVLVLPGFFSREYAPEARFKVADKVRARIVPFSSMPDKIKQTQQADEIEDVDLDFFYPQEISLIQGFQNVADPVTFADQTKKAELQTGSASVVVDLKAKEARQETMRRELDEINRLLAEHGGDWEKWYESTRDFRSQYLKQHKSKAQRWLGDSFFSAGHADSGTIYSQNFIKSIIAFKNYLAERNVDLILVRVPKKGEVVDDLFAPVPSDHITNPYLLRMYKELLEADVEIITNIIPRAKEERLKYPLMYWYQDFSEDHPAEGISWVIAEEFARRASRYSQIKSLSQKIFSLRPASRAGKGWLSYNWPAGNPKFDAAQRVEFSAVTDAKGSPVRLTQGQGSPVLVLGSSFIATPALDEGASIPHYFTYLTGVVPDIFQRNEGDLMMPRNVAREGDDFLRGRSVCLFPFTPYIAYDALASLPIFDAVKSKKTPLATYSAQTLLASIELTPPNEFFFSQDGILELEPAKKPGDTARIRLKVPDAVSNFTHFAVEIEFAGKDRTKVIARYSGQSDLVKRSENQLKNNELFTFATQSSKIMDIDLERNPYFKSVTEIKAIKFYGVERPEYYKH